MRRIATVLLLVVLAGVGGASTPALAQDEAPPPSAFACDDLFFALDEASRAWLNQPTALDYSEDGGFDYYEAYSTFLFVSWTLSQRPDCLTELSYEVE